MMVDVCVNDGGHAEAETVIREGKDAGILGPRGEEFNPGPETKLDHSELLCNKVLLKNKGDRESF